MLSEKSDEEKGGGDSEKLEKLVEKGSDNSNFASESEMEDSGNEYVRRKERAFVEKKANFIRGGLQRTEKKQVLVGKDTSVSEEYKDLRLDQCVEEREYGSVDRYTRLSEHQMDPRTCGTGRYTDMSRSESVNSSLEEISTQLNRFTGSLRSRAGMGWSGVERGSRLEGLYGNNSVSDQERARTFGYPDEGTSNYDPYLFRDHERQIISGQHVKVPDGVKNLEQERAEILRKLDELKEQLSRSYHVADKPKEREPMDRTLPYPYGIQVPYNVSMQPPALDKQVPRPPHYNYSHGSVPHTNHHHVDKHNLYPPRKHSLNKIPEYDDPFQPQLTRKPHRLPPHQYQHVSPHEYYSGQYRTFDLVESIASYPHETFSHAPTCACLSCYNQNLQVPPSVPPTKAPINPNFYRHGDPVGFGPQSCPSSESLHQHLHTRWPGDLESEHDSYGQPRRVAATCKTGRLYHPIAGGAPFITCHKCFELLKLPRKLGITGSNEQRLRCGACSAVILLEMENKKLILSDPLELKRLSAEGDENSQEVSNDSLVSSGSLNANGTSSCSEDFKKSGYNFQSALVQDERLNLDEFEKRRGHTLSSSISSREDESFDCVISREDVFVSAEMPLKNVLSPKPPRSPVWQESDSPKHAINRYGQGNKSKRMEHDNEVFSVVSMGENSVKDTMEATELDVSFEEYQNNSLSQDSTEICKEEDRFKFSKGSDSFFAGFIRKGFRDFSKSNYGGMGEKPMVFINGQPLPDRVVKRAEKFAGPIRPGDYW